MDHRNVATFGLNIESCLKETIFDPLDIRVPQIDLANSNNSRYLVSVDQLNNFLSLPLDPLSRRHNQNDHIGDTSSSSSHVTEGLMTRGIDKCDFLIMASDVESTYFLSYTSHLAISYRRLTQIINQSRLTVIHMTHYRYNR